LAKTFELKVAKRIEISKKARRQAIEDNQVLGNIFGEGDSIAIKGNYREFFDTVKEAGKNHPIKLVVDGKEDKTVLIRDIERDTLTQRIHHVTFRVIKEGEKIRVKVPVHLVGEAPGVKAGLMVVHIVHELEVATLPNKIPEVFDVDISNLEEDGDGVNIEDLNIDKDIEILSEDNMLLAKIEVPRAQLVEEEEEEVEGEEGEEGEGDEGEDAEGESSTESDKKEEAKEE